MDITKPLPTTVMAVDADLRARADFCGVDKAGEVHYLLGMCEALLAEANRKIERLTGERDRLEAMLEAVPDHREFRS